MNFRPGHVDAAVVAMRTAEWWRAQPLDDGRDRAVATRVEDVMRPWAVSDNPVSQMGEDR